MNLTPEQQLAGATSSRPWPACRPSQAWASPLPRRLVTGGPVLVGVGGEGRVLLAQVDPAFADAQGAARINPAQLTRADEVLAKTGKPKATHYADYKEMLAKEDIESVILAEPCHGRSGMRQVACSDAKHVLLRQDDGLGRCERMRQAARRTGRVSRFGLDSTTTRWSRTKASSRPKGRDIYTARIAWHRNGNWRRTGGPAHARLWFRRRGGTRTGSICLLAALQTVLARAAGRTGQPPGQHRQLVLRRRARVRPRQWYWWRGGRTREVDDHAYATFDTRGGRTAMFSSILNPTPSTTTTRRSSAPTTSPLKGEAEAYLFEEGGGTRPTGIEVAAASGGPARWRRRKAGPADAAATASGGDWRPRIARTFSACAAGSAPVRRWPRPGQGDWVGRRLPARVRGHRTEDAAQRGAGRRRSRHATAR